MKFTTRAFGGSRHQHPEESEECDRTQQLCEAVRIVRPFYNYRRDEENFRNLEPIALLSGVKSIAVLRFGSGRAKTTPP
jgi:hypothetical protein